MAEEKKQQKSQPAEEENRTPEEGVQGIPAPDTELESLKAKLTELEQSAAIYKDQLLRKVAEFENYKKKIDGDFSTLAKFSNEELITDLLPVLDDFDRSMKTGKKLSHSGPFYQGMELIYNKFKKILEDQGLQEIDAVGKVFDVYYHEALMQIPKDGVEPHTVLEEVAKGYTLHGKVIRHAKVVVASEQVPMNGRTEPETKQTAEDPKIPPGRGPSNGEEPGT